MSDPLSKPVAQKALSLRKSSGFGAGCGCFGVFFFGIFLLVGSVNTYFFLLEPLGNYLEVNSWVETPCVILESDLRESGGSYRIDVTYEYTYLGQEYQSDQYRHGSDFGGNEESDPAVVERLQPGNQTVCYVDPEDPAQAVLSRSFPWIIFVGVIPLLFMGIGLAGITFSVLYFVRGRSATADGETLLAVDSISAPLKGVLAPAVASDAPETRVRGAEGWVHQVQLERPWLPAVLTGPQELKGSNSPLLMFIGLTVFALFWNGLVSIFVSEVISDWMNGRQPWFLTLFMLPFLAVGIGTVLGAIYFLLASFNPKPQLYISSPSVLLGETARLKWVLRGNVSKVRELRLRLVGEEVAEYRKGTNTYTDTHAFYEDRFYVTSDLFEIESGEASVTVPAQLMHTLRAGHNQIRWTLKLQGDIPFWPDVQQSFELIVLPSEASVVV